MSAPPVVVTHPEKVLFPDDGITKGELAAYYARVAPLLVPQVQGRPVTMERFPAGIQAKGFIQKDVSRGAPAWLPRAPLPKKGGVVQYPLITDERSLAWMANQNCVTLHVWPARVVAADGVVPHGPDLCVIDLDPSLDDPAPVAAAALAVRDLLAELGLTSWVKTSGSRGYHIVVPLDPAANSFDEVWRFGHGIGAVLVRRAPDQLTQEFIKADRRGRILVDTGRNGLGATFAAVYTVRARAGAPVSAPCSWDELERGAVTPQRFTLRTMERRLDDVGDLWHDLDRQAQPLAPALTRLSALLDDAGWRESLAAVTRRPRSRQR